MDHWRHHHRYQSVRLLDSSDQQEADRRSLKNSYIYGYIFWYIDCFNAGWSSFFVSRGLERGELVYTIR
jgi:hypothetical protein